MPRARHAVLLSSPNQRVPGHVSDGEKQAASLQGLCGVLADRLSGLWWHWSNGPQSAAALHRWRPAAADCQHRKGTFATHAPEACPAASTQQLNGAACAASLVLPGCWTVACSSSVMPQATQLQASVLKTPWMVVPLTHCVMHRMCTLCT